MAPDACLGVGDGVAVAAAEELAGLEVLTAMVALASLEEEEAGMVIVALAGFTEEEGAEAATVLLVDGFDDEVYEIVSLVELKLSSHFIQFCHHREPYYLGSSYSGLCHCTGGGQDNEEG